jgi:hypothetical protein
MQMGKAAESLAARASSTTANPPSFANQDRERSARQRSCVTFVLPGHVRLIVPQNRSPR